MKRADSCSRACAVALAGTILGGLMSPSTQAGVVNFGFTSIDFVEIGNPGNAADTTGTPDPAGAVGYNYQISKYEISRDQVTAANTDGGLGITLDSMSFVTGGARADMPATGISWYEAATFVNHLNTSQGHQAAYKFDTVGGTFSLWTSGDSGYDASNPYRNSQAQYWLPDVDEWYKAAYHDPNTGLYYDYPTGSNSAPTAVASGTGADTAVYGPSFAQGPADVTIAGDLSPYGVMGLGGNVWEWEETALDLVNDSASESRGLRGGSWGDFSFPLQSGFRAPNDPTLEFLNVGFRVAGATAIPEPGTSGVIALIGGLCVLMRRKRRQASL